MWRSALLSLPVLVLAACGEQQQLAAAGSDAPDAPVSADRPCDATIVGTRPDGLAPAARTAEVVLQVRGNASRVKLYVFDGNGRVAGETFQGEDSIVFRPDEPFAPGPHFFSASVCRSLVERAFEVGTVHHALSPQELAALEGRTIGLDLRYGTWADPAPLAGRDLLVRLLFGGALAVTVDKAGPDSLSLSLRSAVVDGDGSVAAGDDDGVQSVAVAVENPYAVAPFAGLELDVEGHTLRLADGALVVGLTEDGLADVRLAATVDVRDFGPVNGVGACELLASYTEGACGPCPDDQDGDAPFCFSMTLEGLSGAVAR